jgi:nucleotide-binding universal stress UspA family protein
MLRELNHLGCTMFSNFLLAFDGTREGHAALHEATELATRLGARLHLVSCIHLSPGALMAEGAVAGDIVDREAAEMSRVLSDGIAALKRDGLAVEGSLCPGLAPALDIAALAKQIGADLIVIGHREQSLLGRLWNGSVGQQLIAHAPCSVLVAVAPGSAQ